MRGLRELWKATVKAGAITLVEICVRLYGSYECMCVDPMKYRAEFEKVLKKNNWSSREILKKSLEGDLSELKPSSGVDREVSGSKERKKYVRCYGKLTRSKLKLLQTVLQLKLQKWKNKGKIRSRNIRVLPKRCRLRLLKEQKQIRLISLKKQAKGQSDRKLIRGLRQMAQILGSYLRRYINTSYIVDFGDTKQFGGPHKSVQFGGFVIENACQKSSWIKVKRDNKYDGIWAFWFLFF
ncbi:hypothetical protein MRB53_006013 [Persea americana]|uniref:Uncharacterized protein n=1 Tax=Persea americana TaxID=3435 RepID=A0ACC2MF19_PERAE|nr:hypothetical protein MRB53_006013 [Persea americana]